MIIKQLLAGLFTYLPGMERYSDHETGGSDSARYCYSVWLRHLVKAFENNLSCTPQIVMELGPGDSLGLGLAALLCGVNRYIALDAVPYATAERNLSLFEELIKLFRDKAPIPGNDEFPKVQPYLENYEFPDWLCTDGRLDRAMQSKRLEKVRCSIREPASDSSIIGYYAPWQQAEIIHQNSVDMIVSQAVLEYVDDLEDLYSAMGRWLKPGGYMSHLIDFKSHGTTQEWNGHWKYSDWFWKLMRGRRPIWLNRQTHTRHLSLIATQRLETVCDDTVKLESSLEKNQLSENFREMCDADLVTGSAFIQARKES